jgi:hypothetical protein
MDVHTATVIANDRLRHEGHRLAVRVSHVVNRVFQQLHFVGLLHQRIGIHANFALTCRRNFVMVHFHAHAELFERHAHGGTNILEGIDGWDGEIAAFDTRSVRLITVLVALTRAPRGFD